MSTWASDFLDEDTDMSDPLFYQRQWADARLAALRALSDAAHKGRVEEAERPPVIEKAEDVSLIFFNNVCPECHCNEGDCICNIPFSDPREVTG
jgi:hypothetical protein